MTLHEIELAAENYKQIYNRIADNIHAGVDVAESWKTLDAYVASTPMAVKAHANLICSATSPMTILKREAAWLSEAWVEGPVFIRGETGTGKDSLARICHGMQRRGKFFAVNCGAITPELFESEIFGHVRGAFTGATSSRGGILAAAEGGTVFFDEIGDLRRDMQVKLLRVLENRTYRAVGSDTEARVEDVKFIFATHVDVSDPAKFRPDLFYRLAVHLLEIPRGTCKLDQVAIVEHYLEPDDAATFCMAHRLPRELPGNHRELTGLLRRWIHRQEVAKRQAGARHERPLPRRYRTKVGTPLAR